MWKDEPKGASPYIQSWGKPAIDALLKRDPARLEAEAIQHCELVVKKHGSVKHPTHGTLASLARAHLASLRNPVDLDRVAPEIEGEDIEGKPLKLSQFRGKVVLLSFWGNSFPPCRDTYASQRELVKKMAGKPFVLLGVNGDADRAALKKFQTTQKLPWRSWWDGGVGGPIATRWEVDLWPTVILLDHKGVVQGLWTGWPERKDLEEALAKVLKGAEKGK
jgi:peroxiredoxin